MRAAEVMPSHYNREYGPPKFSILPRHDTLHLLNKSWKLKSVVLAIRPMDGSNTASNIAEHIRYIVAYFGIAEKVTDVVHNEAGRMVAVSWQLDWSGEAGRMVAASWQLDWSGEADVLGYTCYK